MKTFLAIVGSLALIAVILIGALFFIGFQKVAPLLQEAHDYADQSIPAIAENWDGEELSSRSAPELTEILKNGVLEELMSTASSQLGAMTSYDGAACQLTHYEMNTETGELALAECSASADFEKGKAHFRTEILKRNSEWKIFGFYLTPVITGNQAVQVAYTNVESRRMHNLELSLTNMSIGISSRSAGSAGAGIQSTSKIENIN